MYRNLHTIILFWTLLCFCGITKAQDHLLGESPYSDVSEEKLIETKWKYTYALHVGSNTAIHQANNDYDFFLYFKYNFTYQQFLNGRRTKGKWHLKGSELSYNFKHIKKFFIAEISNERLVLEFTQPNSKGTYQYHFIPVSGQDAPFIVPPNELPLVDIRGENPNLIKRHIAKKKRKKRKRRRKKEKPAVKPTYISIELVGGGYYGGIDPVLRDYIQIKTSGRLIKEFQSVNTGLVISKKDIPRDELEAFAEFIEAKNFFSMERIYDCKDEFCMKRKRQKPTPVPLRLMVAYGKKKKVVTISIWGQDRNDAKYVNYPKEIDQIITSIQKMANRLD